MNPTGVLLLQRQGSLPPLQSLRGFRIVYGGKPLGVFGEESR